MQISAEFILYSFLYQEGEGGNLGEGSMWSPASTLN